jgi:hypothetical protein
MADYASVKIGTSDLIERMRQPASSNYLPGGIGGDVTSNAHQLHAKPLRRPIAPYQPSQQRRSQLRQSITLAVKYPLCSCLKLRTCLPTYACLDVALGARHISLFPLRMLGGQGRSHVGCNSRSAITLVKPFALVNTHAAELHRVW